MTMTSIAGQHAQNRGREVFMKRVQLEGEAGENEGGNGMLIEADRYPTLYTSRTAQRRAQPPPNLPDRRRIFPDRTSAVLDRDTPSEKSEDWGNARTARIQSSAAPLRECHTERAENASRLCHTGLVCRTRGLRRGSSGGYASFPLGGARLAGRCIVST